LTFLSRYDNNKVVKIVLTPHAQDRIAERGIKKNDVIDTIKNPTTTCPTRHRRRKRVMKNLKNQTIDVIIEERPKCTIVVTCAVLKKEA